MTRRFTKILAAFALLVGLTIPMGMWGQAPVNTVLWGETWTDGGNAQPSAYDFSGTTVYGNATLTYANSSTNTKLYDANLAGGTAPELLLAKNNTTWTITGIPSGSAIELTLSFKANYDRTVVSTTTTNVTIGTKTFSNKTVSYPISVTSNVSSFELVFTNTTGDNVRIDDIQLVVTTAGGGSDLTSTTTTITSPGDFNNDLYVGTTAGTLTASVTETNGGAAVSGATVVWESTDTNVATVDQNGTVTLVAVGTTNITATYAGNTTYAPSTGTYQLNVVDNTPFNGVIFTSGTDIGSTTSNGSPDEMTKENVRIYGSDAAFATAEYRMYKNSTTTISTTDGSTITKIEFTNASSNPATGFANQTGWTTNNNGGVWEGEATSVSFVASNAQVRATLVKVTVTPNTNPLIIADDVNISYDATSGSIVYTINNEPDPAGTLAASVPQNSWLTLGTVGATVPFTCATNMSRTARTETVTLTYTYNTNETVTKEVTVTQAGNPNVFDNISEINASGVSYKVRGTVLATSNNGFVIGDNTGYVYTYKSTNLAVGNKVILEGTTGTYGHVIQFTDAVTITNTDASNYDGQPAVQTITEVPDYTSGLYLSTYFQYVGSLSKTTVNNKTLYLVAVGESSICISYPSTDQTTTLEGLLSKTVHVKGYFSGINSSGYFTTIMESIEEVPTPSVTVTPSTIEAPYEGADGTLSLTYENITEFYSFDFYFCDANGDELDVDPDWIDAEINEENDTYTLDYLIDPNNGEARTAYMKVYTFDDEEEEVFAIVTVTQAAAPEPSITVTPATVSEDAEEHEGTLALTYVNLEISNMTDFVVQYYDENDTPLASDYDPEWIEVLVAEQDPQIGEGYVVSYFMLENEGSAHTVYFRVYALGTVDYVYSNLVTITQAAPVVPPTPGTWVLTSLAELTEDDIFVIVGTDNDIETSYALPNDKGTSTPDAVVVYVVDNTLSGEPDARLQWNISGNATNGYTFYPNGSTETWLYCTASNDGVRVGTNSNKTFTFVDGSNNSYTNQAHYLFNTATSRYVGVYTTNPDWRCYTSVNNNICNQSFAFYKKVVEPATETYTLDIAQYTSKENGWYLIASPVSVDLTTNDMVSGTYDLYRFNPTAELEWENYKATENNEPLHTDFTTLEVGRGYLYANGNGIQLSFTGVPSNNGQVNMPYAGWNLVGNPLSTAATITNDYYRMNDTHTGIMTEAGTGNIALMEGVFVQAAEAGQTVTFTPAQSGNNNGKSAVEINLSQNRGGVIDRAIVRFGSNNTLPKFQLFENSTKIYIAQDGEDYAIVNAEAQGEMPVNFKAAENGTYTLTVNPEGVEMNYLHLIDNMTGMDVDLLQTPSYTFNATTNDYESRFRLVFAANNEDGVSTGSTAFAFYSNGNWIINNVGDATLQVIDVTGRVLSSETVSGSVSKTINAVPGVYMLRLINGENVNVQKIVVR